MQTTAQKLLGSRTRAGLTQVELAERCQIAQPNIAAFERGVRKPSLDSLRRLALGLKLPLEALLKESTGVDDYSRFDFDAFAKNLAKNVPHPSLDKKVWQDLQTIFHPKLRALFPGPRPTPRISASSALQRVRSLYGKAFLQRLDGRFSKLNLSPR